MKRYKISFHEYFGIWRVIYDNKKVVAEFHGKYSKHYATMHAQLLNALPEKERP